MAAVQKELDRMQAQFDAAMKEKRGLEEDANLTQRKMDTATALIKALAGEETRWTAQSNEFAATIQKLAGDCALASSFVSYCGPFNKEFRELLMTRDLYQVRAWGFWGFGVLGVWGFGGLGVSGCWVLAAGNI
jgi:dynein heavy chain